MVPPTSILLQATPGPIELSDVWPVLVRAAWFLGGFLAVYVLGRYALVPATVRVVDSRNPNNPTITQATARYLWLVIVLVALLVGAAVAGYGRVLSGSALVVAAGTLGISVAGQRVVGSLVSGVVLVLDPEFNIGDYIEWDDGSGTIRAITLRVTRVQTLDGELVTIPNTVLTDHAVTRPYGHGRYRVVEHVSVPYEADVGTVIGHLEAVGLEVDRIEDEPGPSAYVDEFEPDAVGIRVHYWVRKPAQRNMYDVRSEYAEAAKARLDDEDVTISPPSKRDLQGAIDVRERR